jgi:hypothetical protein
LVHGLAPGVPARLTASGRLAGLRYVGQVSPAFPLGAAALAAACGWPASAAIFALGVPADASPRLCPRCGAPAALASRLPVRAACRQCRAGIRGSIAFVI